MNHLNRIIKFRGYNEDHGWVYGDLSQRNNGECYIIVHSDGQDLNYFVAPESVGMFTGNKDIKGKEIYEGDIVKGAETPPCYVEWVGGSFFLVDVKDARKLYGELRYCRGVKKTTKTIYKSANQ